MSPPVIRLASPADLETINSIYNFYVTRSTATYQESPETMPDRLAWFARHGPSHPITVAELGGKVVGWGSLSPFHTRSAYRHTVESSVYVADGMHRRGIGKAIMIDLIARARAAGHHTIIALIESEQLPSLRIHESLGFKTAGNLREVGHKMGRWLDVIYMQLMI